MSRVLLLEKDPWVEAEEFLPEVSRPGQDKNIRRPFYGISVKENSFASLSVRQLAGGKRRPISLINSASPQGWGSSNHNFILQSVSYSREEKAQIVETFGDHYVFFYGERPVVISCSGILFNTRDFNWKNEWERNYNQFLRGTKCVENRARVFLAFDDVVVSGYILSANIVYDKAEPVYCPFGFNLLLTDYQDLSETEDYVRQAGDTFQTEAGGSVEYLAGSDGEFPLQSEPRWVVDPLTGESRPVSLSGDVPDTQQNGTNTGGASSITAPNPNEIVWRVPATAAMEIDINLAAQETGDDVVSVKQDYRKAPGNYATGLSSSQLDNLRAIFNKGVSNTGTVAKDAVPLE